MKFRKAKSIQNWIRSSNLIHITPVDSKFSRCSAFENAETDSVIKLLDIFLFVQKLF